MSNRTLISAYGVPSDRLKLEELAGRGGLSSSQWLIRQIREAHRQMKEAEDAKRS